MSIICPHCNKEIELTVAIPTKEVEKITLCISRLAMAKDERKLKDDRQYERISYDPAKDRFLVRMVK